MGVSFGSVGTDWEKTSKAVSSSVRRSSHVSRLPSQWIKTNPENPSPGSHGYYTEGDTKVTKTILQA